MITPTAKMLVISPHPDDSILGAGGTMARVLNARGAVTVLTITAHMPPIYPIETFHRTVEEGQKALSIIGVKEAIFLNEQSLIVKEVARHDLNNRILDVIKKVRPNIVLLPYFDRHIDHRAVFESVMVASHPHRAGKNTGIVASYEILSSTHANAPHLEPNFTPNWIVDISDFIDIKIEALKCCESQIGPVPHPRSLEACRALALFRGSQAGMVYGEGFYVLRMTTAPETVAWFRKDNVCL